MEDLADEQRGFYREIGIFLQPATGSGLGGAPCGERLFGEPNRDRHVGATLRYIRASWSLCNALFRSYDGGSDCVCTASAFLQVKLPRIMPDRPPPGWKIDLFNNATGTG